ncbi:MAG: hypothetical protein EAY65_06795 [Alphaproteobacteria bacterium]|nr:MAG: hypothetical protein EAY65_06795 [Alphaproteobacteria bacterium]
MTETPNPAKTNQSTQSTDGKVEKFDFSILHGAIDCFLEKNKAVATEKTPPAQEPSAKKEEKEKETPVAEDKKAGEKVSTTCETPTPPTKEEKAKMEAKSAKVDVSIDKIESKDDDRTFGKQVIRVLRDEHQDLQTTSLLTDADVRAAGEKMGIIGKDGVINKETLKAQSTERWTRPDAPKHVQDMSKSERYYVATMLVQTGFLEGSNTEPSDNAMVNENSYFRHAALQAGVINKEGVINPTTLKELDEYHIDSQMVKIAQTEPSIPPKALEEARAAAAKCKAVEPASSSVPTSTTPPSTPQGKQCATQCAR